MQERADCLWQVCVFKSSEVDLMELVIMCVCANRWPKLPPGPLSGPGKLLGVGCGMTVRAGHGHETSSQSL